MGYTISHASIIRNKAQLDQMLETKASLRFDHDDPKKLAYKIREAIASAIELSEAHPEFKKYGELRECYTLRQGERVVVAEYSIPMEYLEGTKLEGEIKPPKPTPPKRKTLPDALSLADVLVYAIKLESDFELHFPSAVLDTDDRLTLFHWTEEEEQIWRYIDHDSSGVTLTKREVPEEVLWRPVKVEVVD